MVYCRPRGDKRGAGKRSGARMRAGAEVGADDARPSAQHEPASLASFMSFCMSGSVLSMASLVNAEAPKRSMASPVSGLMSLKLAHQCVGAVTGEEHFLHGTIVFRQYFQSCRSFVFDIQPQTAAGSTTGFDFTRHDCLNLRPGFDGFQSLSQTLNHAVLVLDFGSSSVFHFVDLNCDTREWNRYT